MSYQTVKSEIQHAVELVRAKNPDAANYLQKHIVFDDNKETVCYTGKPGAIELARVEATEAEQWTEKDL